MTTPISQRRKTTYCDECQLWLPCHKYDAPYRAEEVLHLCDVCVLEVLPTVDKEASPRWVLDRNSDVWARWVSDGLYHQGNRTVPLADVVKHYGPVQVLVLGEVIRDVRTDGRARCGAFCTDPGGPHRRDCQ